MSAKVYQFPSATIPCPAPDTCDVGASIGAVWILEDGCERWLSLASARELRDKLSAAIECAEWLQLNGGGPCA